jgi:hypothetical protein
MLGASVGGQVRIAMMTPAMPGPPPVFTSWRAALDWCREQGVMVFNDEAAKQLAAAEDGHEAT